MTDKLVCGQSTFGDAFKSVNALADQNIKKTLHQNQPISITSSVTEAGAVVASFETGLWSATVGSPVLTNGYSGYDAAGNVTGVKSRTGQAEMLLVQPTVDSTTRLELTSAQTNILTPSIDGKIGFWVYIDPNNATGDIGNLQLSVNMSNDTTSPTDNNSLLVGWNNNSIRAGWNFCAFVMRNPDAYNKNLSESEDHPYGISVASFGDGNFTDIKNNDLTLLWVNIKNGSGIDLYFDSFWTKFNSKPQVVIGCDGGDNFIEVAIPEFSSRGFSGYTAFPFRVYTSGSKIIPDLTANPSTPGVLAYNEGWDFSNHTANHLRMGDLTSASEIDYEMTTALAWQNSLGLVRGAEFYVSPQSSTSKLSEKVISDLGYKLQRHAAHTNNHVTIFGVDNPSSLGSSDISSNSSPYLNEVTAGDTVALNGWQTFSKIKRGIDLYISYGSAFFPFWHGITETGDTGSGEDLTGSDLLITKSAFIKTLEYLKQKEDEGVLIVQSFTEFYYGKRM